MKRKTISEKEWQYRQVVREINKLHDGRPDFERIAELVNTNKFDIIKPNEIGVIILEQIIHNHHMTNKQKIKMIGTCSMHTKKLELIKFVLKESRNAELDALFIKELVNQYKEADKKRARPNRK